MGNLTHTVSGDIASFRSAARVPIESLKCYFKPKQDLHGYDKPWPAGGGNNIWDEEWEAGWINSDGENTNPTSMWRSKNYIPVTPETTYAFVGKSFSSLGFRRYDANKDFIGMGIESVTTQTYGLSFTTDANTHYIRFFVNDEGTEKITNIAINYPATVITYSPYSNICPIEGWDSCTMYKTGKNVGHIIGFSASATTTRVTTNSYGTTIDTINFNGPNGAVVITQSQAPQTSNIQHYQNGYIAFYPDNLIFGQKYNISFKVSNIISNPLNTTINYFKIINPYGSQASPSKVEGDTLYFNNFTYKQRIDNPNIICIDIRTCGMSCTISDFIITPANVVNDGVWEPYCGDIIPITFPVLGKNKLPINSATITRYQKITLNTPLPPGVYTVSALVTSNDTDKTTCAIMFEKGKTNGNNLYVQMDRDTRSSKTFTLEQPISTAYIYASTVWDTSEGDTATWTDIQLEEGDTATTYEPYNSNNTVYGGYVDVAKGEVVQTWKIVDLGDYNWDYSSNTSPAYFSYQFSDRKLGAFNLYCSSLFLSDKTSPNNLNDNSFIGSTINGFVFIRNDSITSATDFISSMAGVKLAYELSEPIHYHLSKIQLQTFLDQNNIWSNTNDITEVSYQIHDSNMIHNTKLAMMAHSHDLPPVYQQYDYLRTSGSNARIDTGVTGDDTTLQIECEFKFTQINNSYVGVFGNYKNENAAYCWRIILPNISTYPEPSFLYATAGNGTPGNGNGLSGTMGIYPCYENNTNPPILNKKIKIDMKYGSCHSISSTKNYTVRAETKTADANTNNICLGAMSTTSTGGTTQCRIYSFKLYSQNHLVRNYVPCVRKSDSKVGFYDLVNHTFNPSIGSVEFVAGNEE